jgi:hypothetical protein
MNYSKEGGDKISVTPLYIVSILEIHCPFFSTLHIVNLQSKMLKNKNKNLKNYQGPLYRYLVDTVAETLIPCPVHLLPLSDIQTTKCHKTTSFLGGGSRFW